MPNVIRAILLMITAMFFFTLSDLFVKLVSQTLPSQMVVTIMGAGTGLVFYSILRGGAQPAFQRSFAHWSVMVRAIGEIIAAFGIMVSLSVVPLATVTAIMQSQPLLLTLAAAVFLRETIGLRRLMAVLAGLVGVLFILRPGMGDFSLYSWVAVIGVLGMTMRDLGSRLVPSHIPTMAIVLYGAIGTAIMGAAMMIYSSAFVMPVGVVWFYLVAMVLSGTGGIYFITQAMRLGEVSVVSPFRYVKIVFGMGAGILVFGETIDAFTALGALIVTAAGIYAFMRERHLLQQANAVPK